MTYDSPQALRTALEHRLLATSRESGVALDRLRRRVLFERVVSRIEVAEPGLWVLKGGMALEVRLSDAARLTKDIDVGLRDSVASPADLHERLIDALSNDPFNDRFTFEVSEPAALREDGGGHPTWRVPVAAFLAAKPFGAIKVDVSPRAHELQATDRLPLPNSLDFAGIPTTEVEIVDVHRHAAAGKHREDLVFTSPEGAVLRVSTWRPRVFKPAVKRLVNKIPEFPTVTPHDLRHTAASLSISAGANVKPVQTMLGHASAVLTLDTYADLFPDDLEQVSAALDVARTEVAGICCGPTADCNARRPRAG